MITTLNYINHSATMQQTTNFASAWQTGNSLLTQFLPSEANTKLEPEPSSRLPYSSETTSSTNLCPTSTDSSILKSKRNGPGRLNKFVRRLHDMLQSEKDSGIVEWRKGLLVLHSTAAFAKKILPKYFNTQNFKTFRRQLNYYGFVHVRSYSNTGSSTTALWVNQDLAKRGTSSISSVLLLKRVEPCDETKTAEGRRLRKEEATSTVEDIGINTHTLRMEQVRQLTMKAREISDDDNSDHPTVTSPAVPRFVNLKPETDHQSFSCSSTPSLICSELSFPCEKHNMRGAGVSSSYPETDDDAANLLIMFSKSAHQL